MKYLVFTGSEFGVDPEFEDGIKFIIGLEKAEDKFQKMVQEYGCAAMYKVEDDELVLIKSDYNF